jgi:2-C-methyl-D-erythritol 4-phosphate cytidylyltransferase / 2-C-methyl-D-erythritol 2,4-cyclodiphosphate synthase
MNVYAIIAAGGRGRRLGSVTPKQLLSVAGRPILQRSVEAFLKSGIVTGVIVVVPPEMVAEPPLYLRSRTKQVRVVAGGEHRHESVANGFAEVPDDTDIVVIHDAARPFVSVDLIERTVSAAAASGAAIAALPASDTVKEAGEPQPSADQPAWRYIARTLSRERIFLAQTPQAFRRYVLGDAVALARSGVAATDEAALAEMAGHPVLLVPGETRNIKITSPEDLVIAEAFARYDGLAATAVAVGMGYDLHRLVEGRRLVLGGLEIESPVGLLGHSDADVLCHAVTDAVLGGAAAGDIGALFPDTDPRLAGISSIQMLRHASGVVREAGFTVANVDVVVIAERPKLLPYVEAMRRNVASALGIDAGRVSIKGKTNEGVGEIGRGEAIAAHAVAMLRYRSPGRDVDG